MAVQMISKKERETVIITVNNKRIKTKYVNAKIMSVGRD